MRRGAIHRLGGCRRDKGFMLVELLVAAVVVATILTAAFAWLWNVAALADGADDGAQAETLVAAVSRALAADLHAAVGVAEPPIGRDPSRSLTLVHDHAASAAETVLVAWDPARGVVWRNASGTYVSDHITQFDVAYVLADGSLVDGELMGQADWASVRAARVLVTAAVGSVTVRRPVEASVGPS
jgi:type II secretory pathway component PulJ